MKIQSKPDGQPPRPFTSQRPHVLHFTSSNATLVMLVEGLKTSPLVANIERPGRDVNGKKGLLIVLS